jgi:hypothetical protein
LYHHLLQCWEKKSNIQHFFAIIQKSLSSVFLQYSFSTSGPQTVLSPQFNYTCCKISPSFVDCYKYIHWWWPANPCVGAEKNNPTVPLCRKRRQKGKPSAWEHSWATLSLGDINSEAWSSRLRVGHGANNPTPVKNKLLRDLKKQKMLLKKARAHTGLSSQWWWWWPANWGMGREGRKTRIA